MGPEVSGPSDIKNTITTRASDETSFVVTHRPDVLNREEKEKERKEDTDKVKVKSSSSGEEKPHTNGSDRLCHNCLQSVGGGTPQSSPPPLPPSSSFRVDWLEK